MREKIYRMTNTLLFLLGVNILYALCIIFLIERGMIPREMLSNTGGLYFPVRVITFIILPILEELFFRHLLLRKMDNSGYQYGNLVQAIVFALMHAYSFKMPNTFISGLIYGNIYRQERNIRHSISVHLLYNVLSTFLLWVTLTLRAYYGVIIYGIVTLTAVLAIFVTWKNKTFAMLRF